MSSLQKKIEKIKCLLLDVDGVLTNGRIIYGTKSDEIKMFHAHDGLGLKLLQKTGIEIGVITARQSDIVAKRMNELGVTHVFQNSKNKLEVYEQLKTQLQLEDDQIAYIGDDLPDLKILKVVGFSISVADAQDIVKKQVDFVTEKKGGKGAVREVCNLIIQTQGNEPLIVDTFLR